MRDIRMYVEAALEPQQSVVLPADAHRHCRKVLRLRRGDRVTLFNGNGFDYLAIIEESDQQTTVLVQEKIATNTESPLHMILYLALLKGEAADRSVQKAVELGAQQIGFFECERSERQIPPDRRAKKMAHWRGIVVASAMQCGRAFLPEILPVQSFSTLISAEKAPQRWIFSPHDTPAQNPLTASKQIALLIGPEGGFSPAETAAAVAAGWQCQSLGRRILRADTAAIAAMVRAQSCFGDLQ